MSVHVDASVGYSSLFWGDGSSGSKGHRISGCIDCLRWWVDHPVFCQPIPVVRGLEGLRHWVGLLWQIICGRGTVHVDGECISGCWRDLRRWCRDAEVVGWRLTQMQIEICRCQGTLTCDQSRCARWKDRSHKIWFKGWSAGIQTCSPLVSVLLHMLLHHPRDHECVHTGQWG